MRNWIILAVALVLVKGVPLTTLKTKESAKSTAAEMVGHMSVRRTKSTTILRPTRIIAHSGCEQYIPLLERYRDWNHDVMLAIMKAESGCHYDHINNNPLTGDYSIGLFQINLFGNLRYSRPNQDYLLNPVNNIDFAHTLYVRDGLYPWTTWTNGKYKKYL